MKDRKIDEVGDLVGDKVKNECHEMPEKIKENQTMRTSIILATLKFIATLRKSFDRTLFETRP